MFAICQLGWTTPLINDWATISLYADKGDLSFQEKRVPYVVHFVFYKCTSLKAESRFNIEVKI